VTLLVVRGTLKVGDADDAARLGQGPCARRQHGERVKDATPGDPVEVLGFDGVPEAGECHHVVESAARRTPAAERANR